jgi:putative colanic acid biosynthesis UDP-glucose lipid carrier transferase
MIVVLAIKITDRGPILYSQDRYGHHGKTFKMLKFRSMEVGSDSSNDQVTAEDKRVTPIGKFIRQTSFDELPQLINVLKGDMSMVGPRPHIISDTDYYSEKILRFLTRHQVKPGLTGLAQISSRDKTSSVISMEAKLEKDLEYINNWSFYLDVTILLKTPISLWVNRNSTL